MFLIWAIPVGIVILLIVWALLGRLQHRVQTGERQEGRVLKD